MYKYSYIHEQHTEKEGRERGMGEGEREGEEEGEGEDKGGGEKGREEGRESFCIRWRPLQPEHLRLREHHGRGSRKTTKARTSYEMGCSSASPTKL